MTNEEITIEEKFIKLKRLRNFFLIILFLGVISIPFFQNNDSLGIIKFILIIAGMVGLMFIRYKIRLLRHAAVWEKIKKESENKTFNKELSGRAKLVIGIYIASILLAVIGFLCIFLPTSEENREIIGKILWSLAVLGMIFIGIYIKINKTP